MATEAFEDIADTFEFLDDWEDRYRHVIDMGKAMPPLDAALKAADYDGFAARKAEAASRGKLRARADKGDRGAERALKITEDNERLIGSVLLGNNLVNILAASLATSLFTRAFGESL